MLDARTERTKFYLEIVRTACAVIAMTLNAAVMAHVLGYW